MDRINDRTPAHELSVEYLLGVVSIAMSIADRPCVRSASDAIITCSHPLTNEGCPDEDYLVLSVSGFEECEIWLFKGQVNLEATFDRFCLFGVTSTRLLQLQEVLQEAVKS
jgi:hypothetical protein